jgi:hypothetical protein
VKEIETESLVPLHMDRDARNRRLAQHLLSLGLYVEEVPEPPIEGVERQRVDYLKVSTELPSYFSPHFQG